MKKSLKNSKSYPKKWMPAHDALHTKLFSVLTYRDRNGVPILKRYTDTLPTHFVPSHVKAGKSNVPLPPQSRTGFTHFYLHDYQFERFWNKPLIYSKYLQTFQGTISPDFSVYMDYALDEQRWNRYRSRALGAFWQQIYNIPVIPNISWSSYQSFDYAFDAVEKGSVLSISTVGVMKQKETRDILEAGFSEMIQRLQPIHVLVYGQCPLSLKKYHVPVTRIPAFYEKFDEI